jgi:transposase-like protein
VIDNASATSRAHKTEERALVDLTNPIYNDENAARAHFETIRWPNGPICPHCGNSGLRPIHKINGSRHRPGLYECYWCWQQFTVTVGTLLERSRIPLTKWALAFHLMSASEKNVSVNELRRRLGITYKAASFMASRIRQAMIEATSRSGG